MSEQRKIAIVGTAEPHWRDAPYGDESWEIWSLGGNFHAIPRWTRWFELHALEDTCKGWHGGNPEQEAAARKVYVDWLAEGGDKVYVQTARPEVPEATLYPLAEILDKFPDKYFTNSVSYMVAMALAEGCTELGLWGVDMALSSEYGAQRPSVEFFMGIAAGMGVALHLPPDTSLLKCRTLYAFGEADNDGFLSVVRAKKQEVGERLAFLENQKKLLAREIAGLKGSMEVIDFFGQNWER